MKQFVVTHSKIETIVANVIADSEEEAIETVLSHLRSAYKVQGVESTKVTATPAQVPLNLNLDAADEL